ncbi:efflux transporter outer membrane subunit [Sphingobacterium sp. Mn56C]|uniref:efflux transporter outer membrane subunit n=1 Tax=Sphingobacterium sp. Mn56C TaxID=3395261 RepID=UPI003BE0A3D3
MKTRLLGLLWMAAAVLAAACSVSSKYVRTELKVPEVYREALPLTGDSLQLSYKNFFTDPHLLALIDSALAQNLDVGRALKTMEQLDLMFKEAKHSLMPTVDLNMGANRNWVSKRSLNGSLTEQFTGNPYLDDYNIALQISWEADIWGKAKLQKDVALHDYFSQRENLVALKTRIVAQVAQAYYNLLGLDQQLRITQENIALSRHTVQLLRLQFTSGQVNALAVQQAEAQLKTAELLLPLTQQQISVQENALTILMGDYPKAITRSTAMVYALGMDTFSRGVPADLLSRRADLKAAEYAVISLNAKTGLAKIAMYPALSITPQLGLNSYTFNHWFDLPGSLTKTLAANLTQPILQKRRLKTAYQSALLDQEKAALNFKQVFLQAVAEVSDALAKSKGAEERLKLVQARTESLDQSTIDAIKLFKSGMATYLEVIVAQSNKLQNDLEYQGIVLDKLNAELELYRALGGGID